MKRYLIIFFSLCISVILFYTYVYSQNKEEIDNLLYAIDLSNNVIYSGRGSYDYKYTLVSDKNYNEVKERNSDRKVVRDLNLTYKYVFYNNSIRIERYDNIHRLNDMTCVFNGYEFKRVSSTLDKNELIHSVGYISNNINFDMANNDPLYYESKQIESRISLYNGKKVNIRGIYEEEYKDINYNVIEFHYDDRDKSEKYYVDPTKDYKVFLIKSEETDNNINLREETTIDYQSINSLLFPSKVVKNTILNDELIIVKELIINDDWQFNININSEEFELAFPKGMQIMNVITNSIYIEK